MSGLTISIALSVSLSSYAILCLYFCRFSLVQLIAGISWDNFFTFLQSISCMRFVYCQLFHRYLEEMSKKSKNQKEDLQRALNRTMRSLQNTTLKLDVMVCPFLKGVVQANG